MNPLALFMLLAGVLELLASAFNWDWYFEFPHGRNFHRKIGRPASRLFHVVTGLVLLAFGGALASGRVVL